MMAVDPAVFAELQATTGKDFVGELIGAFCEEAPRMIDDLRKAAATGDAESFRRTAHSLKSNANTFGATVLADQARALELGGIDPDAARTAASLDALDAALVEARTALERLQNG
jgi:HPt (histidine-containing phosphotransfer) domain-containing protein